MTQITLAQAQTMIEATLAEGRKLGLKPLSAIVLDTGGHPKAFAREDNAAPGRYAIAEGKAYGAIMLGMGGQAQMARAESQAYFMAAVNGVYGGRCVPVPGGVLVLSEGQVIGALGVTGDTSDNDVLAAMAGIQAAGLDGQT